MRKSTRSAQRKKTLVLGASPDPKRYSYMATVRLKASGHEVFPVGIKKGAIQGLDIINGTPHIDEVDTITLYLGPQNQPVYYDYIFSLNPKRIIFNPGTENPWLFSEAEQKGIEALHACTLIMLSVGNY
jgi:uncharacterized protein